jgi:hypothetical protein
MPNENFATRHEGPPSILDWDVVASDSARSPFQGFVKFSVPIRLEETDEAKQSRKLDKDYRDFLESLRIYEQENNHSASVIEYRYEFDVSSDAPELRRAWILTAGTKSFVAYEPKQGSCWDSIASSPKSAGSSQGMATESPGQSPVGEPQKKDVNEKPPVSPVASARLKVVSFAWADEHGVYLASPQWTDDWVKNNAKKFPAIRFSQAPVSGAANYLVVITSSVSVLSGFQPVLRTETTQSRTDASGRGTVTDNDGSIWSYTYRGTATTSTTTMTQQDVPYTIESHSLYASVYGGPLNLLIARHSETNSRQEGGDPTSALFYNLGQTARRIRLKTRLLNAVANDIVKFP